jgi:hypothetical protein
VGVLYLLQKRRSGKSDQFVRPWLGMGITRYLDVLPQEIDLLRADMEGKRCIIVSLILPLAIQEKREAVLPAPRVWNAEISRVARLAGQGCSLCLLVMGMLIVGIFVPTFQ